MFSLMGSGLITRFATSRTPSIGRRRALASALALGAASVMLTGALSAQSTPSSAATPERDFLSRVRRLTVEGRRAGEGYWAPDGKRLVFQSEREPGNPFYQIYAVDLTTGETARISPGMGKTTCSFFRPGTDQILFASTHHDPKSKQYQDEELAFRASGKERRYAWDYDPEMEIYVYAEKTKALTRLTNARGYDAEASYSPDGQWIAFSSMRDAYNRTLSDAEKKQLEVDPSFFGEIYVMKADGSGQKRLTNVNGYDGGPFFSPDGKRIVWRRFNESGLIADVWTMNLDGSDARQVTNFGAMSWAPYIHPSGQYLLFASNKLGFENFEVFMVDVAGTKEPVRITYSDGFDGLPVPSPDGTQIAWTSSRGGGREGQIFLAQWNHEAAMKALAAAPAKK
jgi:Tol biopolymer transport system component